MVLTDTSLNLLTVLLAPMLLALGSVYVVHFLTRFEEDARAVGNIHEAVLRCVEHMRLPVLIAGLTTMVGFGALLISDVPAVFQLGLLSALGIAATTVLVLTAVPAALLVLPPPAVAVSEGLTFRARIGGAAEVALDRLLTRLARMVNRRAVPILFLCAVAGLVSAAALPNIVVDTDYLSYFEESDPVRLDFEAVNRMLAGAVPLYVVLEGTGPGTFRDPAVLRGMETLQRGLDALPGVSRTISFVDSLRTLNRAFGGDDPGEEKIPDTRGGVTELLFMLPKAETFPYLTINHSRANIVLRTGEVGSAAISRLKREIDAVIESTPLPGGVRARVTGNALLLARSADGIARGQPRSVALAAVAIFLLITVGLRSPRLGAVAMIPNLLPVLVFFGVLGLGAAPLSLPTSLIGCIALGIAIDDTVHFLVRYRAERDRGADPQEAALRCGRRIGRPIAITSIMLVLGFLVVAFSGFATLREFGLLTAVTMAICLVTDLILLPALLIRLRI
jgi:predicted RND superfamily exporter protein